MNRLTQTPRIFKDIEHFSSEPLTELPGVQFQQQDVNGSEHHALPGSNGCR